MNEALIRQIEALPIERALSVGDSALTTEDKAVIDTAYLAIRGKAVKRCSCKNRYTDALMELRLELGIKKRTPMKNYELKAGRLIWIDGNPYSNANLTDEVAERWRRSHSEHVETYFQRYPEEIPAEEEKPLKTKKKTKKQNI